MARFDQGLRELAALERLKKKSHILIMGENVVSTLVPLFLIGSSSFLQEAKNMHIFEF